MQLSSQQFDRFFRLFRRSDSRLDGRVYVAVRTTGIYCMPSCRARKPRPQNARFYFSRAQAEQAGFRPCRKCRPEIHGGRRGVEQAALRRWLESLAEDDARIGQVAQSSGVSPSRLYRMFRRNLGYGPRQARGEARLRRACQLLQAGERSVTQAAYDAGFGSLATFYRWFRRATGMTPTRFRRQASANENPNGSESK